MTRKEEIIQTARQKEKEVGFSQFVHEAKGIYSAYGIGFLEGAEWADKHPILEVKEVDLTDKKTDWSPSKKQMESLRDLLEYNIGVFDYQKFMEVNSLYEDLIKILDCETDR